MVEAARERGVNAHVGDVQPGRLRRHRHRAEQRRSGAGARALTKYYPMGGSAVLRVVDRDAGPGKLRCPIARGGSQARTADRWSEPLRDFPFREGQVDGRRHTAGLFIDAGRRVDARETTDIHELTGQNPVLEWISGTALRPVKSRLTEAQWQEFRRELIPILDEAYPARSGGTTFFPFRRIFVVAQVN